MDTAMFCYQCEQTGNGGTGCVLPASAAKIPRWRRCKICSSINWKGFHSTPAAILKQGRTIPEDVHLFVIDALFSTLTNVNFDPPDFLKFLRDAAGDQGHPTRVEAGPLASPAPLAATYALPVTDGAIQEDARRVNIRPSAGKNQRYPVAQRHPALRPQGHGGLCPPRLGAGLPRCDVNNYLYHGLSAMLDDSLDAAEPARR